MVSNEEHVTDMVLDPGSAAFLDGMRASGGKPLHETLSDREYQVMWMIASGKTVRQIADELFLSPNTVSTHRTRILRKMNMKSNAELMHYAIAHHLVD